LARAEIDYTVNVQVKKAKTTNAGVTLKKLRLDQGVSVSQLARTLGVARSRVHELETGVTGLKPHTAWWYADALAVDHKEPVRLSLQDAVCRYCGGDFTVSLS
ncbi:MAG: Helix-turn-helix domain, partial [Pseudomonadota bacterium]